MGTLSQAVVMLVPDRPFQANVNASGRMEIGARAAARAAGLPFFVYRYREESWPRGPFAGGFPLEPERIAGVILFRPYATASEAARRLQDRGIPVVCLGWAGRGLPFLDMNERLGARLAIEHLVACGHRRIAWLGCTPDDFKTELIAARQAGFWDGVRSTGLAMDSDLMIESQDFTQAAETAFQHLWERRRDFTAVAAFNDFMAIGVWRVLFQDAAVREDALALIGSDNVWSAHTVRPRISTVGFAEFNAGYRAVEHVLGSRFPPDKAAPPIDPAVIPREATGGFAPQSARPLREELRDFFAVLLHVRQIEEVNETVDQLIELAESPRSDVREFSLWAERARDAGLDARELPTLIRALRVRMVEPLPAGPHRSQREATLLEWAMEATREYDCQNVQALKLVPVQSRFLVRWQTVEEVERWPCAAQRRVHYMARNLDVAQSAYFLIFDPAPEGELPQRARLWTIDPTAPQVDLEANSVVLSELPWERILPSAPSEGVSGLICEIGPRDRRMGLLILPWLAHVHRLMPEMWWGVPSIRAEVELEEFAQQLSHARTVAEVAQRNSEEANRAKSAFLAAMTHDLRTTLSSILGFSELAGQTGVYDPVECLSHIRSATKGMLAQINKTLDLSKIESGHTELEHVPFDLTQCIEQVFGTVALAAQEQGLDLIGRVPYDSATRVVGSAEHVTRILLNLVSNAVRHTHAGYVAIEVHAESISSHQIQTDWLVTDTGSGIPLDRQAHIFRHFADMPIPARRSKRGSGLGLAICAKLVERMGGTIHVQSEPGQGSRFEIKLPFERDASAVSKGPTPRLDGCCVVIGHPSQRMAETLADSVGEAGASVRWAADRETFGDMSKTWPSGTRSDSRVIVVDHRWAASVASVPQIVMAPIRSGVSLNGVESVLHFPVMPWHVIVALIRWFRPQEARAPGAEANRDPRGETVLVADDHTINRELTRALVERAGFRAVCAKHGVEVLEILQQRPVDLILMDVDMPEMDGVTCARKIRQHEVLGPSNRRVPIIALTACGLSSERNECLEAGMDAFLSKPLDSADLIRAMEALLGAC